MLGDASITRAGRDALAGGEGGVGCICALVIQWDGLGVDAIQPTHSACSRPTPASWSLRG